MDNFSCQNAQLEANKEIVESKLVPSILLKASVCLLACFRIFSEIQTVVNLENVECTEILILLRM